MRSSRLLYAALLFLGLLLLMAVSISVVQRFPRDEIRLEERRSPPDRSHLFGTDDLGRDTFTRSMYAARVSLGVATFATLIALALGTLIGMVAGYLGGRTDMFLMAVVDVALAVPVFLVLMVLAAIMGGQFWTLCVVLGLSTWMPVARLVRASTRSIRERQYIEAAIALGLSTPRILWRHVLPNTLTPILVAATLGAAQVILIESALSFLGFGLQPPTPTWGNLLREAQGSMELAPWNALFPGMLIFMTVYALHIVGDVLQDRLDPRWRR
jgi:peptide/nickel transport system permease protein